MQTSNVSLKILGAWCLVFGFSTAVLAGDLPCPGNLDEDPFVGPFDLALLLGAWGLCPDPCAPGDPESTCAADFDGDCAVGAFDLAFLLGAWGPCPGPPVNDVCEGAIEIVDIDTPFDTTGATTGGPTVPGCQLIDDLPQQDVWFDYTASCNGLLKVCTCDQAVWDTVLVLYEGTECPITQDRQLFCNDDSLCILNLTSRIVTTAVEGQEFKIRLGGFSSFPGFEDEGPGTLTVACLEGQDSNCCLGNPEPGCDDQECEDLVCSFDGFCCAFPPNENGYWDATCVEEALVFCNICSGGGC